MLSKTKKTVLFLLAALVLAASVFFYELVLKKRQEHAENELRRLVTFQREEINYLTIEGGPQRVVLQKNQGGWFLLEPIQDKADQANVESILDGILVQNSKKLNIENTSMTEYKMDKPVATWNIKTAKGESLKILISGVNNFEGNPFLQVASTPDINLGNQFWKSIPNEAITFFRHKKLLRYDIELVDSIRVTSLSYQFEIVKKGQWSVAGQPDVTIDQKKFKSIIMKLFDLDVQEYISDGEPSQTELKAKGLDKNFVQLDVRAGQETWSGRFQLDANSGQLFGVTDRPTQLVKLDSLKWELLANLNYDQFRDRSSVFNFNPDEVQKFYLKTPNGELEIKKQRKWLVTKSSLPDYKSDAEINSDLVSEYLRDFSRQELDYFLDRSDHSKLSGNNMIILRTDGDQLLMQLVWGPEMKKKIFGVEKEFYLARTQQDPMVFGLAPETVTKLLDFKFIKKEKNK